jgi:putative flippase GtrA
MISKYFFVQLASYVIEFLFFSLFLYFSFSIYLNNFICKAIACLFAFFLHKYFTFESKGKIRYELIRYFSALPLNYLLTSLIIFYLTNFFSNQILIKIASDILIFSISFFISKKIIFK